MPALTLYDLSIPIMIDSLQNLSAVLTKATEHASSQGVSAEELFKARLVSDMLPLPAQVQRASDTAKGVAMRLCNHPPVSLPDEESTFDELQQRIARTLEILHAVKPHSTDGKEGTKIELKTGAGVLEFTAKDYLQKFALPNFFFHVVTAYDILRAQGVPVGKRDFLGSALLSRKQEGGDESRS